MSEAQTKVLIVKECTGDTIRMYQHMPDEYDVRTANTTLDAIRMIAQDFPTLVVCGVYKIGWADIAFVLGEDAKTRMGIWSNSIDDQTRREIEANGIEIIAPAETTQDIIDWIVRKTKRG